MFPTCDFKSRHTVCRAVQENGARANYMSILTGTRFSRICNSMIFYLKNTDVTVEVPAYKGRLHTKFEENRIKRFRDISEQTFEFFFVFFFFIFLHTWKKCCNSQTRSAIQLKFGTIVGCPKAIISINFGENLYKILSCNRSLRKTRTIFRHAYRVKHWLDQPENRFVARFNIRGVPFGSYKWMELETTEIWG